MKDFNQLYLDFAVCKSFGGLCLAQQGYFASEAWRTSDAAYNQVSGRKFGAVFQDGTTGWVDKSHMRRVSSMEEFESLLEAALPQFKRVVDLYNNDEEICDFFSLDMYRKMGRKCSYITNYYLFYVNEEKVWKSAKIAYNDNMSNLPKIISETEHKTYDSLESAIKVALELNRDNNEEYLRKQISKWNEMCVLA